MVRRKEAKQRLTAVEFMKGLHESLDVDAKSLRRNEGLETDAESLHCAESIDADVHVLRRRENSKANERELCCVPIIPQWSSAGEMLSSTMEQSLEKKAVSEDNGQKIPKHAPVAGAALTLPSPPTSSTRASSCHQNGGEPQTPRAVVAERCGSTNTINSSSKSVASDNAHLTLKPGAQTNAPKDAVRPGVDPPSSGETRRVQPPNEELSTTLRLKSKSAVSKEETSTLQRSPKAKTASALPNGRLPIISTQATPPCQTKNVLKRPLPMMTGQHKHIREVISPIPTARNNDRLITKLGARQSAPIEDVDRPGDSLPFHSKLQPSANTPPVRTKAPSTMRRSEKGTIVDIKQASAPKSSPVPLTVMSLLKTPPTVSTRAVPSWLANGKARPPLPMVSKRLQQPVKNAIIKSRTSLGSSSPAIPAMSTLPKHVLLQDQSPISSEIMGEE